jgi:phosphoglycolate phosphatase
MFDALVFDLDGTLWDASEASTHGWNNGLRSLNINRTISVAELQQVTGKPEIEAVRILFPNEFEEHQNLLDVLDHYEKMMIQSTGGKLYDGLETVIRSLSLRYDLFLVSNCEEWYLKEFFKFSGSKEYFKGFDCYGMSKQNKSEMLLNLKKENGFINPAYIGDTEGDETAARHAGYAFIFAGYGFGVAHEPNFKLNSLKELLTIL